MYASRFAPLSLSISILALDMVVDMSVNMDAMVERPCESIRVRKEPGIGFSRVRLSSDSPVETRPLPALRIV